MTDDKTKIQPKVKVGLTDFQKRAAAAAQSARLSQSNGVSMPNRIALMLDCSGSMAGEGTIYSRKSKIEYLRDAVEGFLNAIDFTNTSVSVKSFGRLMEINLPLTSNKVLLTIETSKLDAEGGTPMGGAMKRTIESESLTRGVIISDGQATDGYLPREQAKIFAEASVPVDTIHIGAEASGEELLRYIAEVTGGIYIKFSDTSKLATALKYLSPRYRALLNAPGAAALLGADEVKS